MSSPDQLINITDQPGPNTSGGSGGGGIQGQQAKQDPKIEKLQEHVREVSDIMQMNIDKIMERGSNLDTLQDRSENLAHNSVEFRAGARRVQRKMWWKNMKLNILIGAIVIVILIIIIVSFTKK